MYAKAQGRLEYWAILAVGFRSRLPVKPLGNLTMVQVSTAELSMSS